MAAARQKKQQLPTWDLKDLYPGPNSAALKKDLAKAKKDSAAFHKKHFGKIGKLSGNALGAAVKSYEKDRRDICRRIMSYAQLVHAADVADPEIGRFYQTTQEAVTRYAAHLVFFTLEINQLSDAALKKKLKAPALAHYASWIRDVRVFRPHQLDEETERLLHDKHVAGRAAWNRLFDETMARMRIDMDGKQRTTEEVLHSLSDTKGACAKRPPKLWARRLVSIFSCSA